MSNASWLIIFYFFIEFVTNEPNIDFATREHIMSALSGYTISGYCLASAARVISLFVVRLYNVLRAFHLFGAWFGYVFTKYEII